MRSGKKHISKKGAFIFLGAILFFTFFSRTINYIMSPKVITQILENGYIENTYYYCGEDFEKVYDDLVEIGIDHKLDQPLEINCINVKTGDRVEAGNKLVSFDITPFERSILSLDQQLTRSQIELKEFEKRYKDQISGLEKEIKDYNTQIKKLDWKISTNSTSSSYLDAIKKKNNIAFNLEKAQQDLQYIKTTGILNGKTRDSIIVKIESLNNHIDKNKTCIARYQKVISSVDGVVCKVHYSKYDSYFGVKPLITVIPDNTSCSLRVKTNKDIIDFLDNDSNSQYKIYINNIEAETEVLKAETEEKNCFIYINYKKEYENIDSFKIVVNTISKFCDIIVPNSAFISPDMLYVLQTRQGFWGKEYYVELREVTVGEYNSRKSQITEGLMRGDTVITGWDRELTSGQRVMLPLN